MFLLVTRRSPGVDGRKATVKLREAVQGWLRLLSGALTLEPNPRIRGVSAVSLGHRRERRLQSQSLGCRITQLWQAQNSDAPDVRTGVFSPEPASLHGGETQISSSNTGHRRRVLKSGTPTSCRNSNPGAQPSLTYALLVVRLPLADPVSAPLRGTEPLPWGTPRVTEAWKRSLMGGADSPPALGAPEGQRHTSPLVTFSEVSHSTNQQRGF